jgi:hypothetical protein
MADSLPRRLLRFLRFDLLARLHPLLQAAPMRRLLLFPWGALLGAGAGLLLGLGLFGAVFGLIVGYLLDVLIRRVSLSRSYAEVDSLLRAPRSEGDRARIAVAAWLTFRTAELAERPSYADLHYLSQRLAGLFSVSPAGREAIGYVRDAFLQGVRPGDELLLAGTTRFPGREERVALALSLWEAAALSGSVPPRAEDFIRRAAEVLLSESEELEESYRILGVDSNVSPEELKRVYRSLAASFHPDSLADLSPEQQASAQEAFIRIRRAYERLMQGRGS